MIQATFVAAKFSKAFVDLRDGERVAARESLLVVSLTNLPLLAELTVPIFYEIENFKGFLFIDGGGERSLLSRFWGPSF